MGTSARRRPPDADLDPEIVALNQQVQSALAQTRCLVEEIGATVIALEEFRQIKRRRIYEERQGS